MAWKPSLNSLRANQSSLCEHVCLLCLAMPGFTLEGLPVCDHTLASVILMNEGGQEGANKGGANERVWPAALYNYSNIDKWSSTHLELLCSKK